MTNGRGGHRVSLQRFAKGKRSTHDYKQKRKVQAFKRSKALSKYSKLCAREGIQSERVRINSNKEAENSDPPSEATASVESEDEDQEVQQPAKMSRFHKAQLQAQQLAEEKAKRREEAAKRAAEKEQAIAKRKRVHRQLSKKTRAGQPVMGNKIQHLLGKIQEQKQKEGQQA